MKRDVFRTDIPYCIISSITVSLTISFKKI